MRTEEQRQTLLQNDQRLIGRVVVLLTMFFVQGFQSLDVLIEIVFHISRGRIFNFWQAPEIIRFKKK